MKSNEARNLFFIRVIFSLFVLFCVIRGQSFLPIDKQMKMIRHQWLPDKLSYEPHGMSPDTMKILTGYGHKFPARAGNIASATGIMIDQKGNRTGAGRFPQRRRSDRLLRRSFTARIAGQTPLDSPPTPG